MPSIPQVNRKITPAQSPGADIEPTSAVDKTKADPDSQMTARLAPPNRGQRAARVRFDDGLLATMFWSGKEHAGERAAQGRRNKGPKATSDLQIRPER